MNQDHLAPPASDRPADPATVPGSETSPPGLGSLFIGRNGLRPGWGLLLFYSIFAGLRQTATVAVYLVQHPAGVSATQSAAPELKSAPETATRLLPYEGIGFAMVALTTWIMGRIEHRSFAAYGFAGPRRASPFFAGFAWGIVFLSLFVGALWKFHLLVFDGRLVFGAGIFRQGVIWLIGFLLVALLEESYLRAYLQATLARGAESIYAMLLPGTSRANAFGFWTAAAILSFVFGIGHAGNPGESPVGLISAGLIGLLFCLSLWRTGSLWWAIGFHASWDWAQSFLFGVADSGFLVQGRLFATHPAGRILLSGGTTGPEGSVLILPLLVFTTVVVLLIPKRLGSPRSVSNPALESQ